MFKIADTKMRKLGFSKLEETANMVAYSRYDSEFNYTQIVEIMKRGNGKVFVFSYEKNSFDSNHIGNTCVALYPDEMKVILRKIKEKKL